MRDRYSIVVGLLFAAVIAIAVVNTLGHEDEGTLGLDELPPAGRCRSSPCRSPRAPWKATPTSPRTIARPRRPPAPRTPGAPPPAGSRTPGAIRVCDLFDRPLVISFWFSAGRRLRRPAGRGQRGLRALPWARELPLAGRARRPRHRSRADPRRGWRMPVGYDRDGAVASLYRVGGCPTFAYVYPGGTLQERQHRRADDRQLDAQRRGAAAGDPRGGGGLSGGARRPTPSSGWEPAPEQGWVAPHLAAEFPGLGIAWIEVDGRSGPQPGVGAPAPARPLRPLLRRRTRSTCASGRSPGPTGSSSARSASTPTAPAPRSSSSPSTASTTAPSSAATACPTTR